MFNRTNIDKYNVLYLFHTTVACNIIIQRNFKKIRQWEVMIYIKKNALINFGKGGGRGMETEAEMHVPTYISIFKHVNVILKSNSYILAKSIEIVQEYYILLLILPIAMQVLI